MTAKHAVGGFSLLEILVAFLIVAMLLGVLVQVFDGSLGTVRAGERYTRATVIAQSRLAQAGFEGRLEEGVTSGAVDDLFHWRMTVSPYSDEHAAPAPGGVRALSVEVEVFWAQEGESGSVSLTSMLLRPIRS